MIVIRNFLIIFVTFFLIDLVWLGVIAKNLYRNSLGHIMRSTPNWTAAIIFYIIYIIGMIFFVINPALAKNSWCYALLGGMFFGFVTYMTYDFTNLATLKNWPLYITLIDVLWGTFLGGSTSFIGYYIIKSIG